MDLLRDDINDVEDIHEFIARTKDNNASTRKKALKEMCPCHVKKEIPMIWDRVFEMVTDSSAIVRDQVVHTLCDGAPRSREDKVIETLEKMWNDPDDRVKKRVRRALGEYRRTGNWNIF